MIATRVGVFQPNQPAETAPQYFITREYARRLRDQGLGNFINRAKGFRLSKITSVPELRGESCRMGQRVMDKIVNALVGGTHHQREWANLMLGAEA